MTNMAHPAKSFVLEIAILASVTLFAWQILPGCVVFAQAAETPLTTANISQQSEEGAYCQSGEDALKVGDYKRAEKLFTAALSGAKNSIKAESAVHAGLAEALLWQGKLAPAASELKKAWSQSCTAFGDTSPQAARVLDAYSWLYFGQGKLDKAIETSRQELTVRKNQADVKALAENQANLAYFLETQGIYSEATVTYVQALQNVSKAIGFDSVPAADIMERLAVVLNNLGKTQEAATYFARAIHIKESRQAVYGVYAPKDVLTSVYFRFFNSAPNCSYSTSNGQLTETITANGVTAEATIAVTPANLVKTLRATVTITNRSGQTISVLTPKPTFVTLTPKLAVLTPLDGDQLANKIEKKGQGKAKWTRFWGQDATTPVTSTYIGNLPQWGFFPPSYGYGMPVVTGGNNFTTVTTNVPDWQARARAMAKARAIEQHSQATAESVRSNSLGPTTIAIGASTSGCLDFPITKFATALLQIPVGNSVFEFHFEPSK